MDAIKQSRKTLVIGWIALGVGTLVGCSGDAPKRFQETYEVEPIGDTSPVEETRQPSSLPMVPKVSMARGVLTASGDVVTEQRGAVLGTPPASSSRDAGAPTETTAKVPEEDAGTKDGSSPASPLR